MHICWWRWKKSVALISFSWFEIRSIDFWNRHHGRCHLTNETCIKQRISIPNWGNYLWNKIRCDTTPNLLRWFSVLLELWLYTCYCSVCFLFQHNENAGRVVPYQMVPVVSPRKEDLTFQAIAICFCCCCFTGIPAIFYASEVRILLFALDNGLCSDT